MKDMMKSPLLIIKFNQINREHFVLFLQLHAGPVGGANVPLSCFANSSSRTDKQ